MTIGAHENHRLLIRIDAHAVRTNDRLLDASLMNRAPPIRPIPNGPERDYSQPSSSLMRRRKASAAAGSPCVTKIRRGGFGT